MKIEDSGEEITDPREIYRVLRSLQITRSLVSLHLVNDNHTYSSLLIHTDFNSRQFVLDEVASDEANRRLQRGEEFSLTGFYEGIQVIFRRNRVVSSSPTGFDRAYSVKFPQRILHKQRREAFRAPVTSSQTSSASVRNDNRGEVLQGRIVDLSTTGVGCEFPHYIKPEIEKEEFFQECTVTINDELHLKCMLKAKHPHYQKSTGHYLCGFKFSQLDRVQQKLVDRYVLNLQREARKNDLRRNAPN